ncbi:MAG: hypothetical protein AAF797_10895, partial [Planctomycetota bacterium]
MLRRLDGVSGEEVVHDEAADGVLAGSELVGDVGVEALEGVGVVGVGAGDAGVAEGGGVAEVVGLLLVGLGEELPAVLGVGAVGTGELVFEVVSAGDEVVDFLDDAEAFEVGDAVVEVGVEEPVEGGDGLGGFEAVTPAAAPPSPPSTLSTTPLSSAATPAAYPPPKPPPPGPPPKRANPPPPPTPPPPTQPPRRTT